MKATFRVLAICSVIWFSFTPQQAQAQRVVECINCSTWMTQLLEYANMVREYAMQTQQYILQGMQYANQVINTISLPFAVWTEVTADFQRIKNLANIGSLITGRGGGITQQLRSFQAASSQVLSLPQMLVKYTDWAQQTGHNVHEMQRAITRNEEQITIDNILMDRIQGQSTMAQGQKQAMQAGNQLTAMEVKNTQAMHQTLMSHAETVATRIDMQASREAIADRGMARFLEGRLLPMTGGRRY